MEAGGALVNLRRGTVEHCVLAVLAQGPTYALDLVHQLAPAGLLVSEGTVYPLLARLRREQLVDDEWQPSPSGPPRRYYALTDAGERALRAFARDWARFRDAVDQLLKEVP